MIDGRLLGAQLVRCLTLDFASGPDIEPSVRLTTQHVVCFRFSPSAPHPVELSLSLSLKEIKINK